MSVALPTDHDAIHRIITLAHAFRGAKTLLSAAELGVFTALGEKPLDLEQLRTKVGVAERGARDFFDALVALGMLERDSAGRYSNTPAANLYLDRRKPTYIGGELEHFSRYVFPHWSSLTTALKTGQPQSGARATGHYPAFYGEPRSVEGFARGMAGGALPVAHVLAEKFAWRNCASFTDIPGQSLAPGRHPKPFTGAEVQT